MRDPAYGGEVPLESAYDFVQAELDHLFESPAAVREAARLAHEQSIQAAFEKFHADNPRVYALLCRFSRQLREVGYEHGGIGMIWERMRWEVATGSKDAAGFKLNNNFRSRYARLIHRQEPDLDGFFETRELRAV